MKLIYWQPALVAAATMALTACGGGDGGASSSTAQSASMSTALSVKNVTAGQVEPSDVAARATGTATFVVRMADEPVTAYKGGLKGYDSGETIEQTAERTESANRKLRALKKDIILVAHGAAMETPEDAQFMLDHTTCDGFWTGSSTERIPIERAVSEQARTFAALRFSNR